MITSMNLFGYSSNRAGFYTSLLKIWNLKKKMRKLTTSMMMEMEIPQFTCFKKNYIDTYDIRGSKYLMCLGISL